MIRALLRLLSVFNWITAISRGPGAIGRRVARRSGYRALNRLTRWR